MLGSGMTIEEILDDPAFNKERARLLEAADVERVDVGDLDRDPAVLT